MALAGERLGNRPQDGYMTHRRAKFPGEQDRCHGIKT